MNEEETQNPSKFDISAKFSDAFNATDMAVVELRFQFPTWTQTQIAKQLDITRDTVATILRKPFVRKKLQELSGTWIDILIKARREASRKLVQLTKSKNEAIALGATRELLQLDKIELGNDESEQSNY